MAVDKVQIRRLNEVGGKVTLTVNIFAVCYNLRRVSPSGRLEFRHLRGSEPFAK